ncbi:AAA family ATPase [Kribbella sp. NBC_00662]|uniref:helix-turn-helix transcriptional regulator n=1 Tax=Kribbella sp. NBC_00662 TaxID=2975969 RepID=UPI00352BA362
MGGSRPDHRFAGRTAEQQFLGEVLRDAAGGGPRAVVLHGEAGIGKTRLVREVCRDPGLTVLWGSCIHFGGASVPFAPITGILKDWLARAEPRERAEILEGMDALPLFGGGGSVDSTRVPVLADVVLNRIAVRRRVVVVVDDLQWADIASLDVLSYLLAGFRDQRLALLATCRTEERPEGHPLHSWLADMRRMPRFGEIRLERLGADAVSSQLEALLGTTPDIDLVTQVLARSDGNPYLIELMAQGLSGSERVLPESVPAALRDALLAAWHRLSEPARLVTRLLAVSGRPTESAVLTEIGGGRGIDAGRVASSLVEARDGGVVRAEGAGIWWFRHPLLAEVLYDGLPPSEAVGLHTDYVRVLESLPVAAPAADLAAHHEAAGQLDATYRWSLRAADEAARMRAPVAEAIQLRRACALWTEVPPNLRGSRDDRIALLRRTARICLRAADAECAVSLLTDAYSLVDRSREPLLASELLVERSNADFQSTTPELADLGELREAIALTENFPDCAERAVAFAELAETETIYGMPKAVDDATEAVRVAQRSGSPRALGRALCARAAALGFRAPLESLSDADLSVQLARSCGDVDTVTDAALWRFIALRALGRRTEAADVTQAAYDEATAAGAGIWAHFLAYLAAHELIELGRWDECGALLRPALAARSLGIPGAGVRLAACLLAVRTGRIGEARQHFDRVLELVSEDFNAHRQTMTAIGIELLLAEGRAAEAVTWSRPRLYVPEYPEPDDDEVLPVFARAVAEVARDSGAHGPAASRDIDSVLGEWPHEPFAEPLGGEEVRAMDQALIVAEVARSRDTPEQPERWQHVVETSRAAGNRWHQAMAEWRCAEAGLVKGRLPSVASDVLRQAHQHAVDLGAEPLRREVESLARRSRIDLRVPEPIETATQDPRLAALTDREREVLAFLVAGRSNGEIAKELFISDKTVSVHVSNILRKTGTTSRVAAAALAERRPPPDQ